MTVVLLFCIVVGIIAISRIIPKRKNPLPPPDDELSSLSADVPVVLTGGDSGTSSRYTGSDSSVSHSSSYSKIIRDSSKYRVIMNDSPFPDNLNYKLYRYSAVYLKTNRSRTRTIEAFSKEEARQKIKDLGYAEPTEFEQIPFDPPTESQIEACMAHGRKIPDKACKIDVSYIMDKDMNSDSTPNPELLRYATEMRIPLSYYVGKRDLYDLIFKNLTGEDKIAFFVFCIYRFLSDDRCGNLNECIHKHAFYRFAQDHMDDDPFVKSMLRYSGSDLRFFGTIYINGSSRRGGSTSTTAYKTVKQYLCDRHFI